MCLSDVCSIDMCVIICVCMIYACAMNIHV